KEIVDKPYYFHSLEDALQESGIHLKVKFPDEAQFRIAQIGPMFITAIILIILVMISFIMTLNYYIKEKRIAEKTRDFINNMTHEFKTPLANIAFANNLLRKKESLTMSDKAKKYIEIIKDENIKLQVQLEDLLQISELGDTEIKNNEEDCDIHGIIEKAINSFDMQITESGGRISKSFRAENVIMVANKIHLRNVISNLLDNANKYSSGKPEIKINTYNQANKLIVEVEDKGIGIKAEHQTHIFDKFYRAPSGDIKQARGFGLGLTYVKMVMDAIGGKIEVKSAPGKGSTFRLILQVK
ncbi:MAG: HAMP domain-containing histidine kinase, partial [Bacteroidales bacterium]|nr:HAMP domain-containing histidine kinase [Bacteroidales bacterium]